MRFIYSPKTRPRTLRRGGFTLIEVLIAVALMSLLFAVIMVPLRLGFETFHIGTARSEVQQQAQLILQQVGNDLQKAQFVFPNTSISGVSDNTDQASPCSVASYKGTPIPPSPTPTPPPTDWKTLPYVKKSTATNGIASPSNPLPPAYGVCATSVEAWSNPSRIEMLQVRRDDNGTPMNSTAGQDFIVSYYPRRLDVTKAYDIIDNPIVMWRAQIPFRNRNSDQSPGTDFLQSGENNADINWTNYPSTIGNCTGGQSNRDFLWITHNFYGEADLQPLCTDATNVAGAHTLVTPRGMSLVAPQALTTNSGAYVPELSFVLEATDNKRINRVTVNLTLAQYDQIGAASTNGTPKAQTVRVSRTFDLPSAGCSP